jgi:hypothetical protein
LYLRVVDTWILEQRSIVIRRRRSLLPVVRERQQLVDSFARILGQLGLERHSRRVPTLQEYLSKQYGPPMKGPEERA